MLLLALAATAWVGWREFDHRAAIREAEAAGYQWEVRDPVTIMRKDWSAAFSPGTRTRSHWQLDVGSDRDLASLRPLLLRIRPTALIARACKAANLDALHGLTGLNTSTSATPPPCKTWTPSRDSPACKTSTSAAAPSSRPRRWRSCATLCRRPRSFPTEACSAAAGSAGGPGRAARSSGTLGRSRGAPMARMAASADKMGRAKPKNGSFPAKKHRVLLWKTTTAEQVKIDHLPTPSFSP